ncbi:hypothetical protein RR11_3186 [Ruegeria sp. R11]|nr:hypothetical protein RR11_3186 [Ruegeria sp. R11]
MFFACNGIPRCVLHGPANDWGLYKRGGGLARADLKND